MFITTTVKDIKMKKILIITLLFLALGSTAHGTYFYNSTIRNNTTPSLVGWWTFENKHLDNGAMKDMSGNGHTMYFGNIASSTFYASGKSGQAGAFDGVNDFASTTDTTALRPAQFTLSTWFNCQNFNSAQTLISKPRTGPPWTNPFLSWFIRINTSTRIEPGLSGASYNSGFFDMTTPLQPNRWYHIAMTYNGVTRNVYLDGGLVSTSAGPGAIVYTAKPVLIGADFGASPTGDNANCKIDDVRIYDQAMNASGIRNLAGTYTWKPISSISGKTYINVSPYKLLTTGLVSYLGFDGQNTGWTSCCLGNIVDISGSSNTAVFSSLQATGTPVAGKVGQAFYFKGDNKAAHILENGSVDLNNMSIAFWMNRRGNGTVGGFAGCASNGVEFVTAKGLGGGDNTGIDSNWAIGVIQSSKKLKACFEGTTGTDYILPDGATTILNDTWYHVVYTHTAASSVVYLNGVIDASTGTTANPANNNINVGVGMGIEGATHTPDGSFNGAIDDFRIYNRALSASEVTQLYQATNH